MSDKNNWVLRGHDMKTKSPYLNDAIDGIRWCTPNASSQAPLYDDLRPFHFIDKQDVFWRDVRWGISAWRGEITFSVAMITPRIHEDHRDLRSRHIWSNICQGHGICFDHGHDTSYHMNCTNKLQLATMTRIMEYQWRAAALAAFSSSCSFAQFFFGNKRQKSNGLADAAADHRRASICILCSIPL